MTQHHVGGLSPDAGETSQLRHRFRHLAAEFANQLASAALQRLCFCAKQTERSYERFDFRGVRLTESFGVREAAKKPRRHFVYRSIGALGRQNHRNQELERISMYQRTCDLGIKPRKTIGDGASPRALSLKCLSFSRPESTELSRSRARQFSSRAGHEKHSSRQRPRACPILLQSGEADCISPCARRGRGRPF